MDRSGLYEGRLLINGYPYGMDLHKVCFISMDTKRLLHIDGYEILGFGSMDMKVMLRINGFERSRHNQALLFI